MMCFNVVVIFEVNGNNYGTVVTCVGWLIFYL